jgi:hypothetical protein
MACISDATKLLVYNNSVQTSSFAYESIPDNKNNAVLKGEKQYCITKSTLGESSFGLVQEMDVTDDGVLATWPVTTMPTDAK